MGKRGPKLTNYQKTRILAAYEEGTENALVARVLGVNASQITTFRSRFMGDFGLPPKEKISKSKISGRMGVVLKKVVQEHPKFGLKKFVQKLKEELPDEIYYPSYKTVGRFLKKNNFIKVKHQLKPFISEKNRLKRLDFAKKWIGDVQDNLGCVIWSDETMVRSHPFSRRMESFIHKNDKKPLQEKHHTGKLSVMFWGCISVAGRGPLVVINGSMDSKKYEKVLKEDLLPEARHLIAVGYDVKVMHDNAPCHSSKRIKDIISDTGYNFLDWPPYSPDLNPIENVWAWVKYKLYIEYPPATSEKELIDYVFECWEELDVEMCRKYCLNYNKRLQAVLDAKGLQTKY
jgi:transposase